MLELIQSTDGKGCIIRTKDGVLVYQVNPDLVGEEILYNLYEVGNQNEILKPHDVCFYITYLGSNTLRVIDSDGYINADLKLTRPVYRSTNVSLNLPLIDEKEIEQFVDSYNKDNSRKVKSEFQVERNEAMSWWNDLPDTLKSFYFDEYKTNFIPANDYTQLTGREIQKIWAEKRNNNDIRLQNIVKNLNTEQKQTLFQLIFDSVDEPKKREFLIESEIIDWYKNNCY